MTVALEGDEKSHHCGSYISIVGAVRLRVFTDCTWRAWNFSSWENVNGHEDGGNRPRTNAILRDFSSFPPLMSTGPSHLFCNFSRAAPPICGPLAAHAAVASPP